MSQFIYKTTYIKWYLAHSAAHGPVPEPPDASGPWELYKYRVKWDSADRTIIHCFVWRQPAVEGLGSIMTGLEQIHALQLKVRQSKEDAECAITRWKASEKRELELRSELEQTKDLLKNVQRDRDQFASAVDHCVRVATAKPF